MLNDHVRVQSGDSAIVIDQHVDGAVTIALARVPPALPLAARWPSLIVIVPPPAPIPSQSQGARTCYQHSNARGSSTVCLP
jgi:hypothetical protein